MRDGLGAAAASILLAAAALAVACGRNREGSGPPREADYAGRQACSECHAQQLKLWTGSHHDLAMQPARAGAVLGDFDDASFTYGAVTSTFFRRGGDYFVRTDGPDGALHEYRIAYTFGVSPLQQYLVEFPGGRYQVLGIAWDSRPAGEGGQRWFHLYPNERVDHRDVLHWTGPHQNWNFMCAECHSTNLRKNYRVAEDRFETAWSEIDVSCEACHGPGSRHVDWARKAAESRRTGDPTLGLVVTLKDASRGAWAFEPGTPLARRARPLASRVEVETCGRCHARRGQLWPEYRHGRPLEDTHRVALLEEGLYHADGQILDEVYEYGSFVQTRMYREGVTCSDCHEPHSLRLRFEGNTLCAQCHLSSKYDARGHHSHEPGSEAARCISCHMPERTYMLVDGRRDHSFRVPRPDLSSALGTPNACGDCHKDRSAQWAVAAIVRWYGASSPRRGEFAPAIDAGRKGRPEAQRLLAEAAGDPELPAIGRATAVSLLAGYPGLRGLAALERAAADADPLARRAAAGALSALEPLELVRLGSLLLSDTVRGVRLEAVPALAAVPASVLSPHLRPALDRAVAEYRESQLFNADRAEAHMNLGTLDAQLGRLEPAMAEYRAALRMQPAFIPAHVNLSDVLRMAGREREAEAVLRDALKIAPDDPHLHHALGLALVRRNRVGEALQELAKAAEHGPGDPRHAYIYGVALHDVGERPRALAVLEAAQRRHPADRAILEALSSYGAEAGDLDSAALWARKLAELAPGDLEAQRRLDEIERLRRARAPRGRRPSASGGTSPQPRR